MKSECKEEPLTSLENTADTNIAQGNELPQVLEKSVDSFKEQCYRMTPSQNVIKKKTVKVLEVLSLLTCMKERLGSFGILVSKLHDKAVEMEKKALDPNSLMEDEETSTLFSMLSEKISSFIVESDGSAIQKAIMLEEQTLLLDMISEINEIKKKNNTKLPVDICQIARLTMGKTILETITTLKKLFCCFRAFLIYLKKNQRIYMSVKDEQLKLADSAASSQNLRSMSVAVSDCITPQRRILLESSKPSQSFTNIILPDGELREEFVSRQKQITSLSKDLKVQASTSTKEFFTGTKSLYEIKSI